MKIFATILALLLLASAPVAASSMKDWRNELDSKLDAIEAAEKANKPPEEIAELWLARGDQHNNMHKAHSKNNARKDYKKALKIYDDAALPRDMAYASILIMIGKTYIPSSDKKAVEYFDRAMPILDEYLVADHHIFATMDEFYAIANGTNPRAPVVGVSEMFDTDPTPVFRPTQRFPKEFYMTGAGAWVVVKFDVEIDGSVSNAEAVEIELVHGRFTRSTTRSSVKRGYKREALRSINKYRYRAATRDGEYVRTEDVHLRLIWQVAQ